MHRALEVLNAAAAAVQARTDLDAAVLPHRVLTLSEEDQELPAVCLRIGEDEAVGDGGFANLVTIDSRLAVTVGLYAKASTESELMAELMRLREAVELSFFADQTLGLPFVMSTFYVGCAAPEVDVAGALLAGRIDCQFAVEYRTTIPGQT